MARRQKFAPLIGAVLLVLGAGCSDDDDPVAGEETEESTDDEGGDGEDGDDEGGEAPAGPDDAVAFADPDGAFRLGTGPTWVLTEDAPVPAGASFWTVGPVTDGFAPNVNVLTQPAPVDDVEAYLDLSEEQAENTPGITEVEILDRRTVEGPGGPLGVLEYRGTVGGVALQFVGVAAVDGEEAALATFTAPPDVFAELVEEVVPYLLTLEQT